MLKDRSPKLRGYPGNLVQAGKGADRARDRGEFPAPALALTCLGPALLKDTGRSEVSDGTTCRALWATGSLS